MMGEKKIGTVAVESTSHFILFATRLGKSITIWIGELCPVEGKSGGSSAVTKNIVAVLGFGGGGGENGFPWGTWTNELWRVKFVAPFNRRGGRGGGTSDVRVPL